MGEKREEDLLPYSVGALLYCPANNTKIADDIIAGKIPSTYSLALCLEDAISDMAVEEAESGAISTIIRLATQQEVRKFYMPKIFVRVRNCQQISHIIEGLEEHRVWLKGFIFPKFTADNGEDYCKELKRMHYVTGQKLYMMPTIESAEVLDPITRGRALSGIRAILDKYSEYVLNIRVGGNDFCKNMGVRRHIDETIYDIRSVSNVLSDIAAVFANRFVVSGPVWEYFGLHDGPWKSGLIREMQLDSINGFVGKTVIHPSQIPVVNSMLMVSNEDYLDARSILMLGDNDKLYVEKSAGGNRMNEYKTHEIWARKILRLGEIYGVREICEKNIIPLSI